MGRRFAIEQRFLKALREDCAVTSGSRLLVAVSGGADSTALLRLLLAVRGALGLDLLVAHLDHGIRSNATAEQDFVRSLAAAHGLAVVCDRVAVPQLAVERGCGLELAAREERRAFLRRAASTHGCDLIALGHHRGDQAETVLHRLLRGAGTAGLAAMRPRLGAIIRPLLGFGRDELLDYLAGCGQEHVDDASNADQRFTRNRIRHTLLPLLESFNPQAERQLAGYARSFAVDEDYWAEAVAGGWQRVLLRRDGPVLVLDCETLRQVHPALRVRLLQHGLKAAGIAGEVGRRHLAAVESLLIGRRPQGELSLPGGWVGRRYRELWLAPAAPEVSRGEVGWQLVIDGPGSYLLPGGRVLRVSRHAASNGETPVRVEFDADRVGFPLLVRTRRPGDRLRCSGVGQGGKLKDVLIAKRLSSEARNRQLLVLSAGEVIWAVGLRRCDGIRPEDGSGVLCLELVGGVETPQVALRKKSQKPA